MTLKQSYDILKKHQHWRRCNNEECECEPTNPNELGMAIDFLLKYVAQDLENDL